MNRRSFLQKGLGLTLAAAWLQSCSSKPVVKGKIVGASASIGHQLRDRKFESVPPELEVDVAIIGAGVSGISAAYFLGKEGKNNIAILDLEQQAGGNAQSAGNAVSAFPWGAHYIPTPNNDLTEYLQFLESCGVIVGRDESGQPIYEEQYCCFDPEERLYINGRWQQGLIPSHGIGENDRKQIEDFLRKMDHYRWLKGSDGLDVFALPLDSSSKDTDYRKLDGITMQAWMKEQGYTSSYLYWYVDYCMRDDFATSVKDVSAWVGLHYFACRKGRGANREPEDVLTWPEGNGFLVRALLQKIPVDVKTGCLAIRVEPRDEKVIIQYLDTATGRQSAISAAHCIMALPQFVAARLLGDQQRVQALRSMNYAPWVVANMKVKALEERSGSAMSWDNVLYDSPSLGYVHSSHQLLLQHHEGRNLTYYLPVYDDNLVGSRRKISEMSHSQWADYIIADLRKVHPNIERAIEELDVMIWGHAMLQPTPGWAFGQLRQQLSKSMGRIHFAHTDLAGVSLFEEAFYQGLKAAKQILQQTGAHV